MKAYLIEHIPYFLTFLLYSFAEYKKGKDSGSANSYLEVVLNILQRKQK